MLASLAGRAGSQTEPIQSILFKASFLILTYAKPCKAVRVRVLCAVGRCSLQSGRVSWAWVNIPLDDKDCAAIIVYPILRHLDPGHRSKPEEWVSLSNLVIVLGSFHSSNYLRPTKLGQKIC